MLRVYNTMSRRLEEFVPRENGKVYMYVCGLTPYDYPHVGHGRSAVVYDVMHRYFEYLGYQVIHVSNFTDIDDKIIKRAQELNMNYKELAEKYAEIFLKDLELLNVRKLYAYPRATENIEDIIEMVKELVDKGFAYETSDGVYFNVRKFKDYGKLSHRNIEDMMSGARIDVNEEKHDPLDFAIWKKAKEGEPSWDSPWGAGRPGWHIECSVMSLKYLGNGFDIHGGGDDLIFPHHENEIAQSEACTGKEPFARYWLHNGMIVVDKEKMSKSLKNFFVLDNLLQDYDGEIIRLFFVSVSYRKPLNFDVEGLELARKNYSYFSESYRELQSILNKKTSGSGIAVSEKVKNWRQSFLDAMDDDFNTPLVVSLLFEIFKFVNTNKDAMDISEAKDIDSLLKEMFFVLGFEHIGRVDLTIDSFRNELLEAVGEFKQNDATKSYFSDFDSSLEPLGIIDEIIKVRKSCRDAKNFIASDVIRDGLAKIGIMLEDTKDSTKYKLVMTNEKREK
ncbi:MAG: cysteine--tRNA ligase [Caldisericaceae bacterium]